MLIRIRIFIIITLAGIVAATAFTILAASAAGERGSDDPVALRRVEIETVVRKLTGPEPVAEYSPEAGRPPLPAVVGVAPIVPERRTLAVDQNGEKFYGADPSLVRDGDVWRVFTTQFRYTNVPVWESTDMVTWTRVGDALPELPTWARSGQTWAPDVVEIDGTWVLYFSALHGQTRFHCIGHAVAETAVGPYVPFDDPIVCELPQGGSIDPMVHIDVAGDPHLLWKVDANAIGGQSILRSQPLRADGLDLIDAPSDLLSYAGGWEYPLIEQPEIVEVDGEIHLLYAGGWWASDGYQVGHARCESLVGPCERSSGGGWISTTDGVEGPGSLSVAATPDGWVGVYHAWIDGIDRANGEIRSLIVEPLSFAAEIPEVRGRA